MPAWLVEAVDQARAAARDDQLPVAVVHRNGERYSRALVVMTLGDFNAWFGDGSGGPDVG